MAKDGVLFCEKLEGFWVDVGKPEDFLRGGQLYLEYLLKNKPETFEEKKNIEHPCLISPLAHIDPTARIGPNVVIGPECTVGPGVRVINSCLLEGCVLKESCFVRRSIVGWKSSIGKWGRLDGLSVLGEDVHLKDEVYAKGIVVLPHKDIAGDTPDGGIIM